MTTMPVPALPGNHAPAQIYRMAGGAGAVVKLKMTEKTVSQIEIN